MADNTCILVTTAGAISGETGTFVSHLDPATMNAAAADAAASLPFTLAGDVGRREFAAGRQNFRLANR